eukprot:GILJ01010779.1.p1 GENE.GILJ01010779.1~~GILJ01010779.1.p1  ORF type:complete len:381 (+),score=22.89 GILJ01010779.1:59-1201(+)
MSRLSASSWFSVATFISPDDTVAWLLSCKEFYSFGTSSQWWSALFAQVYGRNLPTLSANPRVNYFAHSLLLPCVHTVIQPFVSAEDCNERDVARQSLCDSIRFTKCRMLVGVALKLWIANSHVASLLLGQGTFQHIVVLSNESMSPICSSIALIFATWPAMRAWSAHLISHRALWRSLTSAPVNLLDPMKDSLVTTFCVRPTSCSSRGFLEVRDLDWTSLPPLIYKIANPGYQTDEDGNQTSPYCSFHTEPEPNEDFDWLRQYGSLHDFDSTSKQHVLIPLVQPPLDSVQLEAKGPAVDGSSYGYVHEENGVNFVCISGLSIAMNENLLVTFVFDKNALAKLQYACDNHFSCFVLSIFHTTPQLVFSRGSLINVADLDQL